MFIDCEDTLGAGVCCVQVLGGYVPAGGGVRVSDLQELHQGLPAPPAHSTGAPGASAPQHVSTNIVHLNSNYLLLRCGWPKAETRVRGQTSGTRSIFYSATKKSLSFWSILVSPNLKMFISTIIQAVQPKKHIYIASVSLLTKSISYLLIYILVCGEVGALKIVDSIMLL